MIMFDPANIGGRAKDDMGGFGKTDIWRGNGFAYAVNLGRRLLCIIKWSHVFSGLDSRSILMYSYVFEDLADMRAVSIDCFVSSFLSPQLAAVRGAN